LSKLLGLFSDSQLFFTAKPRGLGDDPVDQQARSGKKHLISYAKERWHGI
jgi:hypothetical protein